MEDITRREAIGGAVAGLGAMGLASAVAGKALAADGEQSSEVPTESEAKDVQAASPSDAKGYVPNLRMRNQDTLVRKDELLEQLLDEPEPEGDLTLPDGRVIPAIYVKLHNRLNRVGFGCGSEVTESCFDLYTYLWSEDDAKVCCEVPLYQWFNAWDYAEICGKSVEECDQILDDMAQRGLIARSKKSGKNYYTLQPYIAGYWEATELKTFYENGEDPYACHEILSQNGIGKDWQFNLSDNEFGLNTSCPVSVDVVAEDKLMPYMDWRQRIMQNTTVGVAACQCMIVDQCMSDQDYTDRFPLKRCMYLGDSGEYFISIGAAEAITPEEAVKIGEQCMEAGMVPEFVTAKDSDIICFCHSDECIQLQNVKKFEGTNPVSLKNYSAYNLNYDPDKCISCGACIERCPMKAISFDDENKCVHSDVCVRCGQCVTVCPASARILKARDDFPYDDMPYDYQVDNQLFFAKQRLQRGLLHDFTGTKIPDVDYGTVTDSATRTSL